MICVNLKPTKVNGVYFWLTKEIFVLTVVSKGESTIFVDELKTF